MVIYHKIGKWFVFCKALLCELYKVIVIVLCKNATYYWCPHSLHQIYAILSWNNIEECVLWILSTPRKDLSCRGQGEFSPKFKEFETL